MSRLSHVLGFSYVSLCCSAYFFPPSLSVSGSFTFRFSLYLFSIFDPSLPLYLGISFPCLNCPQTGMNSSVSAVRALAKWTTPQPAKKKHVQPTLHSHILLWFDIWAVQWVPSFIHLADYHKCCDVKRCRVAKSLSCCSAEMMSVQDAIIIFFGERPSCVANVTYVGRSVHPIRACVKFATTAEPTTAIHTASINGSDPQASAKSVTAIPIPFDALSRGHCTQRTCSLNCRAFMLGFRASEECASEREMDALV